MPKYYMNKNAQDNNDHEVHKEGCEWMPKLENRHYLGEFASCHPAVEKAKEILPTADGCKHCSEACHTR
jgi:hypothetical protein